MKAVLGIDGEALPRLRARALRHGVALVVSQAAVPGGYYLFDRQGFWAECSALTAQPFDVLTLPTWLFLPYAVVAELVFRRMRYFWLISPVVLFVLAAFIYAAIGSGTAADGAPVGGAVAGIFLTYWLPFLAVRGWQHAAHRARRQSARQAAKP